MGLSTVDGLVEGRRQFIARAPRPELFCERCLEYTGMMQKMHKKVCLGDPESAIRARWPASQLSD